MLLTVSILIKLFVSLISLSLSIILSALSLFHYLLPSQSIIGVIPGIGDWIGLVLGLYQVFLCTLFGLPLSLLGWMILNVVIDCLVGLIPIVGDLLDLAFQSNLRNLVLLEAHLLQTHGECSQGSFSILIPPSNKFIPDSRSTASSGNSFWRFGRNSAAKVEEGPHKGRRTRPISRKTAQQAQRSFQPQPSGRVRP